MMNLNYLNAMGIQPWKLKKQADLYEENPASISEQTVLNDTAYGLTTDPQLISGIGNVDADLMIIGDTQPLAGATEKLLTAMLAAIQIEKNSVYITTILSSRVDADSSVLSDQEQQVRDLLEKQISLVQPKLLLALGPIAAHFLSNTTVDLTELRGKIHQFNHIPFIVTFHPEHLLQNPHDKGKAFQDLQLTLRTLQESRV